MTNPEVPSATALVLEHIESAILSGRLTMGDLLPSERDLSTELNVGRGAVREAIRSLQAQGFVETSTGLGRGTRISAAHSQALARQFRMQLALTVTSRAELTETRIALERSTARMAAENSDDAGLRRIERVLLAMDASTRLDAFNSLDSDFHVAIALAAGNPFIATLTTAIREALSEPIRAASLAMSDWPSFRLDLMRQHHQIFAAIASGDGAGAAAAMEAHIRTAYTILQLQAQPTNTATGAEPDSAGA